MGLVRGITLSAPLVRSQFQLIEGTWPNAGEVIVGRLAAAKQGCDPAELAIGRSVRMEGRVWKTSGRFAAAGSAFKSEMWCLVDDLQQAMKRQDLSLVAVAVSDPKGLADVSEFCKRTCRSGMGIHAGNGLLRCTAGSLWAGAQRGLVDCLTGVGGRRVRRIEHNVRCSRWPRSRTGDAANAGFSRRAIALSIVQEGALLAAAGSLLAAALVLPLLNGLAVRFTMAAFALRLDSVALLYGLGTGLAICVLGSIPPAWRGLLMLVVDSLKAI
jgi:putative ABC transport system permease protein